MTSKAMTDQVAVSQLRGRRRLPSIGRFIAQFIWAIMALLVLTSPGAAVRVDAQEIDANRVPIEIIRFPRGASGTNISGAALRGERSLYSIDARAGQRLSLSISAVEGNAAFQIYSPGARAERRDYGVEILGDALPGAKEGEDAKRWSRVLLNTGAYLVAVGPTRGNATYMLKVRVR
jgi:hypothetical protein